VQRHTAIALVVSSLETSQISLGACRLIVKDALDNLHQLITLRQIHSDLTHVIDQSIPAAGDGMITARPGLLLVDACERGGKPGELYLLEHDLSASRRTGEEDSPVGVPDAHGMTPDIGQGTNGAIVDAILLAKLLASWRAGQVHAVTLSSAEALDNFIAMTGPQLSAALPLFVPHQRVSAHARSRGLRELVVAGAGDDEMIERLVAYFDERD